MDRAVLDAVDVGAGEEGGLEASEVRRGEQRLAVVANRLEHEALASPARRADVGTLLDGARFVTLARLFDTLACA